MTTARHLILIAGMHRSGTSALAGALHQMGAKLPPDLIGAAHDNPDGFWESSRIVAIHDEILASHNLAWDDILTVPSVWYESNAAAAYRDRIRDAVLEFMGDNESLVVKDPRVCRLLPLWLQLCEENYIDLSIVVPVRNPLDVAASLRARNGIQVSYGLVLWLHHFLDTERYTRGGCRLFLKYEQMLSNEDGCIDRLAEFVHLNDRADMGGSQNNVKSFLSPSRRHHKADPGEIDRYEDSFQAIKAVSDWADSAARGHFPPTDILDRIRLDLEHSIGYAFALQGLYRTEKKQSNLLRDCQLQLTSVSAEAIEYKRRSDEVEQHLAKSGYDLYELTEKLDSMTTELESLYKSTSWKLTLPLRMAGMFVRKIYRICKSICRYAAPNRLTRAIYRYVVPEKWRKAISGWRFRWTEFWRATLISKGCDQALQTLIEQRHTFADRASTDPLFPPPPSAWPVLDVSIVIYNNGRWLESFFKSLLAQDYPLGRLNIICVDNRSTDETPETLQAIRQQHEHLFASFTISIQPNRGFGAGHNFAIRSGKSDLILITNIDVTFPSDSLTKVVSISLQDRPELAVWELRQLPYEHPKLYDPVTGLTNWNAHACVLMRRSSFEHVGGYDERIFMYGEDVELSYRLRGSGYLLRYCPACTVNHYSYDSKGGIKPLQYTGSIFANLFIRMRYGAWSDIVGIPLMAKRAMNQVPPFQGARRQTLNALLRVLCYAPGFLLRKKDHRAGFPFREWDYDRARPGAFVHAIPLPPALPPVTIITRTYAGRDHYLRQALFSVAHQTYPNIEHIVVEDGGATMEAIIQRVRAMTGRQIRYIPLEKVGRSAAGNAGLANASGQYVGFLDDDDLLFSDHTETIMSMLLSQPDLSAAYSLAWEVKTAPRRDKGHTYTELDFSVGAVFYQEFDFDVLRDHNYLPIQSVIFKRELFIARGGFDAELDQLEDWNLWQRYAIGNQFKYIPKVTSMYRTPADPAVRRERLEAFDNAYEPVRARTSEALDALETKELTAASDSTRRPDADSLEVEVRAFGLANPAGVPAQ